VSFYWSINKPAELEIEAEVEKEEEDVLGLIVTTKTTAQFSHICISFPNLLRPKTRLRELIQQHLENVDNGKN
jgi:hypothetical protein